MNNPAIVFNACLCATSGGLGAAWDRVAFRHKPYRDAACIMSLLTLLLVGIDWFMLSHDIGLFWWYRFSGGHHLPKPETWSSIATSDFYLKLYPAFLLTMAWPVVLTYLSYFLFVAGITKRQARKAADQ